MNAIPPISLAPSGSDAAQLNAPASAESPPSRGANQDFAGALRDAGGKPARRSAVSKQQDANLSGSGLPVPGNPPPPGNPPLPVSASPSALTASLPPPAFSPPPTGKTDLLAAAQAAAATGAPPGAVTAPPRGAAGADPNAIPAAPTLTAKAGSTAALAPNFDLAAAPASAPGGDAPGSAGNGNSANAPGSAANGPAVPGSGLSVPLAPSIRTLASAATSAATRIPAAPQGSAPGARSGDGLLSQGAIAPASPQASSNALNDPTLGGPAAAAAPAPAVMAAAIVQGTSAPSADLSASSNDAAGPGAGGRGGCAPQEG